MKNKTGLFQLLAVVILLSPFLSFGQGKEIEMELETLDDPYLPNAYHNKKTSPAYRFRSGSALKATTNSIIFTNQVNVNSGGQNIGDDAANEPNIAVNPLNPNEMVIGWRQFDNVSSNFRQAGWAYSTDAGQTWTFPGVIDSGIFRSDPVLDYDLNGNFFYNSLTINGPQYPCKVFESTNGGVTWNNGVDIGGGDKAWMTIDRTTGAGSGNIYSAWSSYASACPPGFFTRSTTGGVSFEPCIVVNGSPRFGTEAVGKSGELYIVGDNLSDSIIVAKSMNAQVPGSVISWNAPVFVFLDGFIAGAIINPDGLLGQVNIDVDRSNGPGQDNVYLCASVSRWSNLDPGDVMFAGSTDGGLTWSSPVQINDDTSTTNTQWFGTMSVAPNGRIDVIWLDNREDPSGLDSSALYYSYSVDQGNTWSANEKLSALFDPHVGYPNQYKMGDYLDMISDNSGAHLAWANTLNGEQDVYYSRIIPSINTGANEIVDNITFSIFPNPTTGLLMITGLAKQSHLEICNVLGGKVFEQELSSNKTSAELNLSFLQQGVYFLNVKANGESWTRKIVKM